jgi:hypothetical protein
MLFLQNQAVQVFIKTLFESIRRVSQYGQVHKYWPFLTYAVNAVSGLSFHGWIPPPPVVDYMICFRNG